VHSPDDVRAAISRAKLLGTKVSIAGTRHTAGGQSVFPGSINLDMTTLNRMQLLPDGKGVRVEAGANWAQVQAYLSTHGRAVKVMQAENVFSVGGTIGANAHGHVAGSPPFISSVRSIRLMNADGEIQTVSRTENPELFKHVVGGYGLFGVVLDVDLDTVENAPSKLDVQSVPLLQMPARLQALSKEPGVELAYGRPNPNFDGTGFVFTVRKYDGPKAKAPKGLAAIKAKALAEMEKLSREMGKDGPAGLEARWWVEKQNMKREVTGPLTQFMSRNVDMLKQYWFNEGQYSDGIQIPFIPEKNVPRFVEGLKALQKKDGIYSSSATMRYVGKDHDSALPYAKQDSYGFVLYFTQPISGEGAKKAERFNQELLDLTLSCGGTFYLPQNRDATPEQFAAAYPEGRAFFEAKRRYDPKEIFNNGFYAKYGS
jgi:FAD/FMN-containing dehydrogenase